LAADFRGLNADWKVKSISLTEHAEKSGLESQNQKHIHHQSTPAFAKATARQAGNTPLGQACLNVVVGGFLPRIYADFHGFFLFIG